MADILCIDIETYSAADISNGADVYAEHPSTTPWCVSFGSASRAAGCGAVWTWQPGEDLPPNVAAWIADGRPLLAHNSGFERAVWRHILGPRYGWPVPKLEQWWDTQAIGVYLNLPVSLEGLAKVFKGGARKDTEGGKLMRRLAHADELLPGRYSAPTATVAELEKLIAYCEDDVRATIAVWRKMPEMTAAERKVWLLDQAINERGVAVDVERALAMSAMAERRKDTLGDEVFRLTGSLLANSTSTPTLKNWLKAEGVELPVVERKNSKGELVETESLNKAAVQSLLNDDNIDGAVRAILDNRIEANKSTSLAKLKRVPMMVSSDGRLRGALRYGIAHTLRWASHGVQVHNLPKDKRPASRRDHVLRCITLGALNRLLLSEERPLEAISSSLRSLFVAAPGKDLVGADFSAIEARAIAWLADATSAIKTFAAGEDIYVKAAADIGSDNRQLGKVCVLALGYGMGVLKFVGTANETPGVSLTRKEAYRVHRAWREANPEIVQFWADIESRCMEAVANRGTVFPLGKLRIVCDDLCLRIRLPSGRSIRYWRPQLRRAKKEIVTVDENGDLRESSFESVELQFFTVGKNKKAMTRESTYSGKLAENVTQALARDLLAHSLLNLDAHGFDIVLHVHDSIVAEVDEGSRSVDEFCYWMTELPDWAAGFPLAAEGYRGKVFTG